MYNVTYSDYDKVGDCFDDVLATTYNAIKSLGHDVVQERNPRRDCINIIFGSYINPSAVGPKDIVYQMEPVSEFTIEVKHVVPDDLRGHQVWDYSKYNVAELAKHGVHARYIPMGPVTPTVPDAKQDIDVLFYGNITARRREIIERLKRFGLNVQTPICFGKERDEFISRSKVVLNLHGEDCFRTFESVRVSYLLSNKKAVVAEINSYDDSDGFEKGTLATSYNGLINACLVLVGNETLRKDYEQRGFDFINTRDCVQVIKLALEEK